MPKTKQRAGEGTATSSVRTAREKYLRSNCPAIGLRSRLNIGFISFKVDSFFKEQVNYAPQI